MSLKGGIQNPSQWSKEFLDTVEDVQKGKQGACERLYKYVEEGAISTKAYNDLIEKYGIKKEEKKTDRLKKIKSTFCAIASVVILFASMGRALQDLVVHYGKGIAVVYFFLWFWAFFYAVEKDEKSRRIERLERENEYLKESLKIYRKE